MSYLGNKGYTIYKSDHTPETIKKIKKMLKVVPVSQHGGRMNTAFTQSFSVFRESENKLYVPRFFGIKEFGVTSTSKLSSGDDIDVPFHGSMRPVQQEVINAYIESIRKQEDVNGYLGGGGLLELECGGGKTVCGLNIVSLLKKKTLIIVQKEFLVNQWVERIQQFLPTARVGRIQASVVDVHNKDIVIGMLQSLSMKDYPDEIFRSFGLTIIDEVHHISSEVFSRALYKAVTPYVIGLSATMERKDGTTYVFKMFLGDIVYKNANKETRDVEVRAIQYYADDAEFNSVKTDYKGNVIYSSLISKICVFNPRNEFILNILINLLEENPNQQIMCLAHNRNVLEYFHSAITDRNIATCGYYVGGMKQEQLKKTEDKQVVIATYSMASEALDIKTLTTLIMITPKTDVTQSIGRILREKHSFTPIVIDIVDIHKPLVNQFNKRKTYYKQQNYSIKYLGWGKTDWVTIHKPSNGKVIHESHDIFEDLEEEPQPSILQPKKCFMGLLG
jgi:superfamily II DNA or RNA helicase